jgi:predicted pyridoxine 5'-phosphate oxidase superfamily flavin-nucleotide-binding protein
MEPIGQRNIRTFMPDQHRELLAQLPFVILSAHDARLQPWATILVGPPGFARSPDPTTVRVDTLAGPPLRESVVAGAPVGLLTIQLETRRRNRMNGVVTQVDGKGFTALVTQSFGNCPQYIQARRHVFAGAAATTPPRAEGPVLSAEAAALVARADTFFIATAARATAHFDDPAEGLDASHRGGKPGFVRVRTVDGSSVTELTWPEFRGNFYFNTLGNIAQNPRTGLLFVDFTTGDVLSLTGESQIVWNAAEVAPFARAERFVRFRVTEGLWREGAVPLRWSAPEPAREVAPTGDWNES